MIDLTNEILASGAFTEKDPPVLGTSGIPLFYFVNTEKLLSDDGKWEIFGDSSPDMISHSIGCMRKPGFSRVIEALADKYELLVAGGKIDGISGFQRRDWPFSGPLAYRLGLKHYSLYKDGRVEVISFNNKGPDEVLPEPNMNGKTFLHVSDLLTKGSSAESGWFPLLNKKGAAVKALINVVSRKQGGEEVLSKLNIDCHSLIDINEDFLQKNAVHKDRCVRYFKNPENTVKEYLHKEGIEPFLHYFTLGNPKLDRALKFYRDWIDNPAFPELKNKFHNRLMEVNNLEFQQLNKQ